RREPNSRALTAWRRGNGLAVALVVASRRFSTSLSIGLGLGRWDTVATTNLVSCAVVPTSSIYGTARRGPTSRLLGWASPIRTRVKGPVAVGPTGGDQY